jgi:phosphoribosylformylglycinamidine synthase
MSYRVHVRVMPRQGLLDPQGQAVEHALSTLGFTPPESVRIGRAIELRVTAADAADAERQARAMCERVLANPVMEDFDVTVETA